MKIALLSDIHFNHSQKGNIATANMLIKIEHELEPDYILIAGDIASSKVWDIEEFFTLLRKITQRPVYIVWGNHDYWGCRESSIDEYVNKWLTPLLKKHNIYHLLDKPIENSDIFIIGQDGWYADKNSPTYDREFIRDYNTILFHELRSKSAKEFQKCLDEFEKRKKKKLVYVNHFSVREEKLGDAPFSEDFHYLEYLFDPKIDYILFGHTHRESDYGVASYFGNTTYVNGGSDYDDPKVKMIEL
jgi:predicted phosphodiesterase